MLLCQDGGGNQHGHLTMILDRLKRRPHRHFGFSIPHVAAHQPIHGFRKGEVLENILNGLQLIRGFFVIKGRVEFMRQRRVRLIGASGDKFPVGV